MIITLLGLILGVLIVFLLEVNYLTDDIKKTIQQSAIHRDKEFNQELSEKYNNKPPIYTLPNKPKHTI
jgi:hypothetical protein